MEYYPRKIEKKLDKWMNRNEIIIIKGPRQSGKTTLLLHLKEKYGGKYITFEDLDMLESFENSPKEFIKRFLENKKVILYIDEAQYCKEVGKKLKLIYDLYQNDLKIIVTGSGSFDIKVEVGKYLVGRAIYFEIFPLSFGEFILWKAKDLHRIFSEYLEQTIQFINEGKPIYVKPVFKKEFFSLLEEYVIYGSFPAIVKEKERNVKIELLKNLLKTYLEKDVFFFFNVRELEKFRKFVNYLSLLTGSFLEFSSITQEVGIDYKTIINYISILINTYFIRLIQPFYKNRITEIKKSKKIYFVDLGIRNAIINNFINLDSRTDKGQILENFVLNELIHLGYNVKYWRTTGKAEIDFIIEKNSKIIPIEVKTSGNIKKGFISFLKSYNPTNAIVFTMKDFEIKKIYNTTVAFLPIYFI